MNSISPSRISERLRQAGPIAFSAWSITAAFLTYFCMYAFRKPFTAGTFEGPELWNVGYKTVLVTAQIAGYMLSKVVGIKVVSEMPAAKRTAGILLLIGIAEAALLLFAVTPVPWNFVWLFVNGLPLGLVFGLVLAFLEGRQQTEALSAGLCASFILASGVVKSVGRELILSYGVSEYWMPFITGLIFVVPLLIGVWMLNQIPQPSAEDVALRSSRPPMTGEERLALFRRHAAGLSGLLIIFVALTVLRSLRDDFAVEIWNDLGIRGEPKVFAQCEFWVTLAVTFVSGAAIVIRNNRRAFLMSLGLVGAGFAIVAAAVDAQQTGMISAFPFMVLLGLGMYIPYVVFHTTIFERLIAAFRETGNLGYLMYLADSLGYLGYILLMLAMNRVSGDVNYLQLLNWVSTTVTIGSIGILAFVSVHYSRRLPRDTETADGHIDPDS